MTTTSMHSEFKYRTTICTNRLVLRPISLTDGEAIFHLRSFPEVYKWTIAGQWTIKSQAREWITTNLADPDAYNFLITLLPSSSPSDELPNTPTIIGSLGCSCDNEIGYLFHPDYWGRGYATEALKGFLDKYFEMISDVDAVRAKTGEANMGSRRVLEKLGFVDVKRQVFENPTLGPQKSVVYELTRPSWLAMKGDWKSEAGK